jgi:FKBP-type peptidyl-prolyl cis-trans isomerase SlyD
MAISSNQIVSILYEVKDISKNEVVDSNMNSTPLTFMMGRGQIIIGLENALSDMSMNDSKDVLVKAVEAYGEYDNEAVQILPREQFAGIELEAGQTLYGQDENGGTVAVNVKSFTDSEVTIDFNHPLAGKDLMFSVHVTMVRNATDDELLTGQPFENLSYGGSCSSGGGSCGCGTGIGDEDPFGGSCATSGGGHGGSCGTGSCH